MKKDKYRPTSLCLSSGGAKGFYEIGGLSILHYDGILDNVDTIVGTSVGAVIAVMYAAGMSPVEILESCMNLSLIGKMSDISWGKVWTQCGIVSNKKMEDDMALKLTAIFKRKYGKIPTLFEFYKLTKKHVILCTVSLKKEKEVYLDYKTFPDLNILKAIRMSSNSPGMFGKLKYQNDHWSDGAILKPYPLSRVDDRKTQVIGLALMDTYEYNIKKVNPLSYYGRIISINLNKLIKEEIGNSSKMCKTVVMPVKDDITMLDNGDSFKIRLNMFRKGASFVREWVDNNLNNAVSETRGEISLTPEVLKTCFGSQTGKIILRTSKEKPELLQPYFDFPEKIITKFVEVPKISSQEIILAPQQKVPVIDLKKFIYNLRLQHVFSWPLISKFLEQKNLKPLAIEGPRVEIIV